MKVSLTNLLLTIVAGAALGTGVVLLLTHSSSKDVSTPPAIVAETSSVVVTPSPTPVAPQPTPTPGPTAISDTLISARK